MRNIRALASTVTLAAAAAFSAGALATPPETKHPITPGHGAGHNGDGKGPGHGHGKGPKNPTTYPECPNPGKGGKCGPTNPPVPPTPKPPKPPVVKVPVNVGVNVDADAEAKAAAEAAARAEAEQRQAQEQAQQQAQEQQQRLQNEVTTGSQSIGGDTIKSLVLPGLVQVPVAVANPGNTQCPDADAKGWSLLIGGYSRSKSKVDLVCLKMYLDHAEKMQDKRDFMTVLMEMLKSDNKVLQANAVTIFRKANDMADAGTGQTAENIMKCGKKLLDSEALAVLASEPTLDCDKIPEPSKAEVDEVKSRLAAMQAELASKANAADLDKKADKVASKPRRNFGVSATAKAAAVPAPAVPVINIYNGGCTTVCPPGAAASAPAVKQP